jgi:hypothetical protein
LLKAPVGGGVDEWLLLPQATRKARETAAKMGRTTRLQNDIYIPLDEDF